MSLFSTAENIRSITKQTKRILFSTFLLSIILNCYGCNTTGIKPNIFWQQHYQAIENEELINHARKTYNKARKTYGSPGYPVEFIHIRHSIAKDPFASISRADILNWQKLSDTICATKTFSTEKAWLTLKELSCSNPNSHPPSLAQQLTILENLNTLIESDSFRSDYRHYTRSTQGLQPTFPDVEESYFLSKNAQTANRHILQALFPDSIHPLQQQQRVPQGIELCERITNRPTHYVLYISVAPSDPSFFIHINHEIFHLLNNKLYDWYVEGLGMVFAEDSISKPNKSWQDMHRTFTKNRNDDPYAAAYFMMRDIQSAAQKHMKTFLNYAVWSDKKHSKMHIDINAWLASLPKPVHQEVFAIIQRYAKTINKIKGTRNSFQTPTLPR